MINVYNNKITPGIEYNLVNNLGHVETPPGIIFTEYREENKEFIRPITDNIIKGIANHYYVDVMGTIYTDYRTESDQIKPMKSNINRDGYKNISFQRQDKSKISVKVHRIVALAFIPNDDPEHKIHVNHKATDGNKLNNSVDKLEWATPRENLLHAYDNGLSNERFLKKEHVLFIADCLMQKMNSYDIEKLVIEHFPDYEFKSLHQCINDISIKRGYKQWLEEYDFPWRAEKRYDKDIIEKICKIMIDKNFTHNTKEYTDELGIDWNDLSDIEKERYRDLIRNIRTGRRHRDIAEKYNII